jgi:hypothetical protein
VGVRTEGAMESQKNRESRIRSYESDCGEREQRPVEVVVEAGTSTILPGRYAQAQAQAEAHEPCLYLTATARTLHHFFEGVVQCRLHRGARTMCALGRSKLCSLLLILACPLHSTTYIRVRRPHASPYEQGSKRGLM